MRINALLTGRGNNTLRDKNILDVLGHPVLYYPAHAARQCNLIDNYYCSSDDDKILLEAEKEGYIKIKRPLELALPTAQHIDCVKHALDFMNERNDLPDILVVLLANNVTIRSEWIGDCINKMLSNPNTTAVVPIYNDNDHHPLRAKIIDSSGYLEMFERNITGNVSTNRQDLTPCYFLSHNFWVLDVKNILYGKEGQQPWNFMGNKILPYIIDSSIDIHQEIDLLVAQNWVMKNYTD